ncbi:hypothetical protein ACFQ88_04700 [Paenibacillus sp. NPDC056579]|nr:hypothetical protein [Paenibacillus sp. H1-7]
MELAKANEQNRFSGLGLIITLFTLIILSPIAYFIINYLLGNEHPVYI